MTPLAEPKLPPRELFRRFQVRDPMHALYLSQLGLCNCPPTPQSSMRHVGCMYPRAPVVLLTLLAPWYHNCVIRARSIPDNQQFDCRLR